jgi:phosphatidylglycerol:prolipoprotein diacylglycerol transferase
MLVFPNIDPVALSIGPLTVTWYALAYVAGFIIGWRYARYLLALYANSENTNKIITPEQLDDFLVWAIFGVILGGRIGYVLFYMPSLILAPWEPIELPVLDLVPFPPALMTWNGGMSFHGGLIGLIISAYLFSRKHSTSLLNLSDILACTAPIGIFFGRIANFVNSELYGRVTDMPWGIIFPNGGSLPRHPSQLYESLLEGICLFVILSVMAHKSYIRAKPGLLSGVFLVGYSLSRLIIEWFREPDSHIGFIINSITLGQILSIPMLLIGLMVIKISIKQKL